MAIELKHITKSFGQPPTDVLHGITTRIEDGEFISLTGKSGSGKSTLLYIMSTLDAPSRGEVWIDGHNIQGMSSIALHELRNRHIGFIFQFHYLLPELTALENVLMPCRKQKREIELRDYGLALLEQFGLRGKEDRLPSQLSGGEQQRVAIARSLIMRPRYLFADEPTGNLDSANGEAVMDILRRVNRDDKTTVIYVTHDSDFSAQARRRLVMVDGALAQS